METKSRGFTIIEVMLFLAISGMLLIGAMAFSSNLISNTRFTDSIRGLESYLQRQYEEVLNGVNPREALQCEDTYSTTIISSGSNAAGTTECLLLGKIVRFSANSSDVETFSIVGRSKPFGAALSNPSMEQMIYAHRPRAVIASRDVYSIPWEAYFTAGNRIPASGGTPVGINSVIIIRSPASSEVGVYYADVSDANLNAFGLNSTDHINTATKNAIANYCIQGRSGIVNQYRAAINIERAQGSTAITSLFDVPTGVGAPC